MRLNFPILGIYAFCFSILYLAGVYFGSYLYFLLYIFVTFAVLSVVYQLLSWFLLSLKQEVKEIVPVAGDSIGFEYRVSSRSPFPIVGISVSIGVYLPTGEYRAAYEGQLVLPPFRSESKDISLFCPYRGVYSIGIKTLSLHNVLNIFVLQKKVRTTDVYVFPRIKKINRFSNIINEIHGNADGHAGTGLTDVTLFNQLREYRDGESIRHIFWKKYASTGRPYLKEFEQHRKNSVQIYFDSRKAGKNTDTVLGTEELSLEILTAIVKFLLERSVPASVYAPSDEPYSFYGDRPVDFTRFYRSTEEIRFQGLFSPYQSYRRDKALGLLVNKSVIIMSHIYDGDIISLKNLRMPEDAVRLVFNTMMFTQKQEAHIANAADNASDGFCKLYNIAGFSMLESVLEEQLNAAAR